MQNFDERSRRDRLTWQLGRMRRRPRVLPRVERLESRRLLNAGNDPATILAPHWTPTDNNLFDAQNGPMANLGTDLVSIYQSLVTGGNSAVGGAADAAVASGDSAARLSAQFPQVEFQNGLVGMEVKSLGGDFNQFVTQLTDLGMQITASSAYYGLVDGFVPVNELPAIARMPQTMSGDPIYTPTVNKAYQGIAYNEAGTAVSADAARAQFQVDGTGVTVGVLSDSVNQVGGGLSQSYATGDLNPINPVDVIQDAAPDSQPPNTDEGRAMLENIHDIAPGANLQFATADGGDLAFANNIRALAAAGSKVIVDDISYPDDPMFQDGLISQAVDAVTAQGVSYFSAAQNNGPDNGYLSTFRAASGTVPGIGSGTFMNFNPNGGTSLELPITTNGPGATIDFQFDQPFTFQQPQGSTAMVTSHVNIYVIDAMTGDVVVGASQNNDNVAIQEPLQVIKIPNSGSYYVAIQVVSGPNPGHVEFVSFNENSPVVVSQPFGSAGGTSYPSSFGHSAAAATIGVGATPWWAPAPYLGQNPLANEPFSSSGPRLVDLSPMGTPITPQVVDNPTITAPDGGNTSFSSPGLFVDTSNPPFFGQPASATSLVPVSQQLLPTFFGTSSAAPNAAAVAALMLQEVPTLTPAQIRATLIATAEPMNGTPQGTWDPQAGFGLIDAVRALNAVAPLAGATTITSVTISVPAPVFGQTVTLTAQLTAPNGGTPTGLVDFFDTATNTDLGTVPLAGGSASLTITVPVGGSNLIEAFYGGAGLFAPSTGYLNLITVRTATTTAASLSVPPVIGQPVTLMAQVTAAGGGTPTGLVDFFETITDIDGNTTSTDLGKVPLVGGVASLTITFGELGKHSIQVFYGGDNFFTPSTTTLNLHVFQFSTTTTATATPNPAPFGEPVVVAISVAGNPPGSGTPTGIVQLINVTNGAFLGSATLVNGAVSVNLALPVGTTTVAVVYNGDSNFAPSFTILTVTVLDSVLVLDPKAAGALSLSGSATLTTPGTLIVDSSSKTALSASGGAHVTASLGIGVVGGVQTSGQAVLSPTPATGVPAESDPLAGLPPPPFNNVRGSVNLGSGTETISPGIFSQISVSGNASLLLEPGIYVIAGGGLTVSGGRISMAAGGPPDPYTGTGVLIYNAGSDFPNPGGSFGAITIKGGTVQLAVPSTGFDGGLVLFQSHDNTKTMSLSGSAVLGLAGGILYAPSAAVSISGSAQLGPADLIVDELQMSGGLATGLTAGNSPTVVPQGLLGVLAGGAAVNAAGAAPVAAIGPAGIQPRRVPSTPAATVDPAPVLRPKVTVYLTNTRDDDGAGFKSPSLLDSEALSEVAAGLAAISDSQANSTGKRGPH